MPPKRVKGDDNDPIYNKIKLGLDKREKEERDRSNFQSGQDLFDNPMIEEARKTLPKEQQDNFAKIGDEMYNTIDFVDAEGKSQTIPEGMAEGAAYIVESVKSGMHISLLENNEKEILKQVYGPSWYSNFGYVEEDVDDMVTFPMSGLDLEREVHKTIVIGHRGACGHCKDNTLESVRKALELGVDVVEVDVSVSADCRLVTFHEESLEDGSLVGDIHSDQLLEKYDIPLLETVYELVKDRKILLDLKTPYNLDVLEGFLDSVDTSNVLVQCGEEGVLSSLRDRYPGISYGLVDHSLEFGDETEECRSYDYIMVQHAAVTEDTVKDCNLRGYKLFVYTVNELEDVERCVRVGVDGIVTDYPDKIE